MPVRESAAPRAAVTAAFKQTSQPEFRRPHAGDAWQRQFGNRATGLLLQAKLRIGEPNDRYEQEADRVSDIVMRTPEPVGWDPEASSAGPVLQRCSCGGSCASCATRDEDSLLVQRVGISPVPADLVQREATETCSLQDEVADPEEAAEEAEEKKETETGEEEKEITAQPKRHANGPVSPDDVEQGIAASRGQGMPLPRHTRQLMESRFGYDFSSVRIHTGNSAHGLNRDLHSLAFTTGSNIYFAAGQFQPGTRTGQHLLAHELTHVVQQAGGSNQSMVREKADSGLVSRFDLDEDKGTKWYYGTMVSGEFIHHRLENILRDDKELVTEAAIPGATRNKQALNKVGIADLYKSTPLKTVSGIRGEKDVESERDVHTMDTTFRRNTRPIVRYAPTRGTRTARGRSFIPDFPSDILLGEIKPLSVIKAGAGIIQLDNYQYGYNAFVARVRQLSGNTRASINFGRIAIKLPTFLDFDHWSTQHATENPRTTIKDRRLWAAHIRDGLYVYFHLAKDLRGPQPADFAEQIRRLREVRESLGDGKHARTAAMTPDVSGKFVQRSTIDRPANYWPERGRLWEQKRSTWGKAFRRNLSTKFKNYRDKLRVEKKLAKLGRHAPAAEQTRVREYKQLMFWSGLPGRFLGKVRFLLGATWDKILGVFERMKEKMHGVRNRVKSASHESLGLKRGWQQALIKVLMQAAKAAVMRFITESFNFFADCFHAAMDKVVARLRGELTERFAVKLCEARKYFDQSKDRLEKEWGVSITQLEDLLKTIQTAKFWLDIATNLIQLIRLGIQIISCLTPPALGCLWGLVAQVGISVGLDLLIGTQWFNDKIVTPTVRDLVRTYATPLYAKLVNRALGEELKEYHCEAPERSFQQLDFSIPNGLDRPEIIPHRDAWEVANLGVLLEQLKLVFEKGKGRQVTNEELKQLAETIRAKDMKPEEVKKMLEAARNPATGKLKLEVAKANVETGVVPETVVKERKIDYENAKRRNVANQKKFGWDPMTFYKKPGVAVDSEEFADAVYDLQEAIRIPADGIVGEQTIIAFYNRNKLKSDRAYETAVRLKEERKAAKEKAARDKAEREKGTKQEAEEEGGELVAIQVGAPTAGTTVREDRYPQEFRSSPSFSGIPFGSVEPVPVEGQTTEGEMITLSVRLWIDGQFVWFTELPATFHSLGSLNGRRIVTFSTTSDFYFKFSPDANLVYKYARRTKHAVMLDPYWFH